MTALLSASWEAWPAEGTSSKPLAWHQARLPYHADGHELQDINVWLPIENDGRRPTDVSGPSKRTGLWVVYIHGGAWKDPSVDSSSFNETAKRILSGNPQTVNKIAGLASINYSLSPIPDHPTDPAPVPGPGVKSVPSRSAKHPDHIVDIMNALKFLAVTFGMTQNYVLTGHSCGATLAFQVAMDRLRLTQGASSPPEFEMIPRPLAIVGLNGLYDMPNLIAEPPEGYKHMPPEYEKFTKMAFGDDKEVWKTISPAYTKKWSTLWPEGKQVVLTQSHEDSLVPYEQTKIMFDSLRQSEHHFEIKEMDAHGDHNDLWKKADELAEILSTVVDSLI